MDLQHETLNHSREIFKNNEVICHFFSDKPNNLPGDRTSRHQVLDTGVTALPISSLNLIIVANSKIIITFATCDPKPINFYYKVRNVAQFNMYSYLYYEYYYLYPCLSNFEQSLSSSFAYI